MLIMVVSAGTGPYSFDALMLDLMNRHVAWRRVLAVFFSMPYLVPDAPAGRQLAAIMSDPP